MGKVEKYLNEEEFEITLKSNRLVSELWRSLYLRDISETYGFILALLKKAKKDSVAKDVKRIFEKDINA